MKSFKQICKEANMLSEGTSGKLSQFEYDLIDANKDRKPGEHGVNKAGEEFKDIIVLEATKINLRYAQKKGSDFELVSYSKSANRSESMTLKGSDLKYLK